MIPVVGPGPDFDCERCLPKCKADCCRGPVPMPARLLEMFPVVRPVIFKQDAGDGLVLVLAEDKDKSTVRGRPLPGSTPGAPVVYGCCPFLGLDNRCSIYAHRPAVCREFGSEVDPFMTCSYQDRDGHVRSRPERRLIERKVFEKRDAALKRMGATEEVRMHFRGRLGVSKP